MRRVIPILYLCACSDDVPQALSSFETPTALVVAGTDSTTLLVANATGNHLQGLKLGKSLQEIEPIASDAPTFPLEIPTGSYPDELAVSPDGRFVAVLTRGDQSIQIVDADRLALVRNREVPLRYSYAAGGARLASSAGTCESPGCLATFYLSVAAARAVIAIELYEDALVEAHRFSVAGIPGPVALGSALWVALEDAAQVVRIDLASGAQAVVSSGTAVSELVLTSDGSVVVGSRPETKDLLFLSTADLVPIAPALLLAPAPSCLPACGDAPCAGAHAANQALCRDAEGLSSSGDATYHGLFLGGVATRLLALGAGAGQPALSATCGDEQRTHAEFLMVGMMDGTLRYVGLGTSPTDVARPELLSAHFCEAEAVKVAYASAHLELAAVLGPCPLVPDAGRFACLGGDDAGVLISRGYGSGTLTIAWEGVLDGLDRAQGGGTLQDALHFSDRNLGADLGSMGIETGDILEVLSEPKGSAPCVAAYGPQPKLCALERRITAIESEGGNARLVLDQPLEASCFPEAGTVAYRVRAGDQFTIEYGSTRARGRPGDIVGFAGAVATGLPVSFRVRGLDDRRELSACDRYATEALSTQPALSRDRLLVVDVADPYVPIVAGIDPNSDASVPVGRLVSGMVLAPLSSTPAVFVSYAGSNTLLGFVPFDAMAASVDDAKYRVLR